MTKTQNLKIDYQLKNFSYKKFSACTKLSTNQKNWSKSTFYNIVGGSIKFSNVPCRRAVPSCAGVPISDLKCRHGTARAGVSVPCRAGKISIPALALTYIKR